MYDLGDCDVCGKTTRVRWCDWCKANLCIDCEGNYPARMAAAMKRKIGGLFKRG